MNDRDRLAADLHTITLDEEDEGFSGEYGWQFDGSREEMADRLHDLGWTRVECWCLVETPTQPGGGVNPHCPQHGSELDEERMARALSAASFYPYRSGVDYGAGRPIEWRHLHEQERAMLAADAAAIAKAYREDTDAGE